MAAKYDEEIDELNTKLQALIAKVGSDEPSRKKLMGSLLQATGQVETPVETVWRIIMSPHAPSALMTLLDMGAIDRLVANNGPASSSDLTPPGGDPLLVARLLRPLSQLGIVHEVAEDSYEPLPPARAVTDPILRGGYTFMFTCATHSLALMPNYLRSIGWKNVEGKPGPFQSAKGTDIDLFFWILQNPTLMNHFQAFMAGQQAGRGDWFDRLPVREMFLDGAANDPNKVLLVDIGGGQGHDVQAFHRAFPDASGKVVLQDLPPVIDDIKELDAAIERQKFDFFTEQPIKGARVYYFRSIMHDWGTEYCVQILSNIAKAMQRGYSKLLLNEFILPPTNVPLYPALLDVNMLTLLNGMERTEKQFTAILDRAGLKVIKFHKDPTGEKEGIVEAELE